MEMTVRETKAGNGEVHPPGLPWVMGWRLCLLPRPSRVQLQIPGAAVASSSSPCSPAPASGHWAARTALSTAAGGSEQGGCGSSHRPARLSAQWESSA